MNKHFDPIDIFFIIIISIYFVTLFLFVSIFLIRFFEAKIKDRLVLPKETNKSKEKTEKKPIKDNKNKKSINEKPIYTYYNKKTNNKKRSDGTSKSNKKKDKNYVSYRKMYKK